MATCPEGHESASEDYCDVCGMLISAPTAARSAPAASAPAASAPAAVAVAAGGGEACPSCGAPKSGQFCESCGFNFSSGQAAPSPAAPSATPAPQTPQAPSAPQAPLAPEAPSAHSASAGLATWTAVVSADREYYDRMRDASGPDADDIAFPAYCPERRFHLADHEVQIGRRSPSRGLDPEIDLTGPPLDPGISRLHAVLIPTTAGGLAILDPGSANGTEVNGTEVTAGQQIPLNDGDRISLGAWTTITVHHQ